MQNVKTFRLFISSTFNDFKLERQVLHEKVFPVIDHYCIERGYTFQPVDLRWGVNDEAQLDQKTLDLCLNEVRACKHYPHPNFLIMLGNRYGWVSLPYAIEKDEFESILEFYRDNNDAISMLKEWYIEDTNHLIVNNSSHAYVIKERDPEGEYKEWEAWEKIENELRTLLQDAANALFKDGPEYRKYFLSATEAEVEEGILKYIQPTPFQTTLEVKFTGVFEIDRDYVYGFIRTIKDHEKYNLENEPAKWFIDKDQTNVTKFRQELKNTLEASNIHTATVTLTDNKANPVADDNYLKAFELFMIEKLENAVDTQIDKAQEVSELDQERSEQLRFKSSKTETFFGRKDELEQVQDYVNDTTTTQPFMVHGISGIGKSSFIAKAIDQTEESLKHSVAYRFIGATASSSNIRTLLESLISDLADQGVLELPETFKENNNKFNEQIKDLLSNIEQPTVIILDALDQLQHKDYMQWLPLELPSNLKIILSMLDQKGYEHYYNLLKETVDPITNQLAILPLTEKGIAEQILDALLKKEKRTLTPSQKKYVLKQFHASYSSPLYLKIAFEEVKTWKSAETTETLSVGIQEIIKEFIDNLTNKFHHDRTIVHKVLGLISASRDGLSEKEILDLLSRDEKILKSLEKFNDLTLEIGGEKVRRFPISIWARLSEQLKPFLNERLIDGQNLITFFHRQIDEAVKSYMDLNTFEQLHIELKEYFKTLQKDINHNETINLRFTSEYPYHVFYSHSYDEFYKIITNLEFWACSFDIQRQYKNFDILEQAIKEIDDKEEEFEILYSFLIEMEGEILKFKKLYSKTNFIEYGNEIKETSAYNTICRFALLHGTKSPVYNYVKKNLNDQKIGFNLLKSSWNNNTKYTGLIKKYKFFSVTEWIDVTTKNGLLMVTHVDGVIYKYTQDTDISSELEFFSIEIKGNDLIIFNEVTKEKIVIETNHGVGFYDCKYIKAKENLLITWALHDESVRVWDIFTGKCMNVIYTPAKITAVYVIENMRLFIETAANYAYIYKIDGKFDIKHQSHHSKIIHSSYLHDGNIISLSEDSTAKVWDNKTGELLEQYDFDYSPKDLQENINGELLCFRTGKNIKTYDRVSKECFSVAMYEEPRTHAILQNGNCLVAHKQYYFFELFNIYEQHTDQVGWARNSMIADNKNFYGDQAMEFLDIGQERFLIRSNYGSKDGNILYLADYSGEYIDSYKFDNYISGMLQLSEFTVVAWSKNVLYLWNISNNNKFELSQVNSITNVCKVSESIILTFDNNKVLTCWDIDKKEILFNFSKFVRKIIDIVPSTADIVYLVNDLRVIYELSVSKQKILRSIVVPSMVSASMNIRENKIIVHENASIAQYQI